MKNDKSKQEKKSPIYDGDARPDKNIEQTSTNSRRTAGKKQKKFTRARDADVNSTEDYKDAK